MSMWLTGRNLPKFSGLGKKVYVAAGHGKGFDSRSERADGRGRIRNSPGSVVGAGESKGTVSLAYQREGHVVVEQNRFLGHRAGPQGWKPTHVGLVPAQGVGVFLVHVETYLILFLHVAVLEQQTNAAGVVDGISRIFSYNPRNPCVCFRRP